MKIRLTLEEVEDMVRESLGRKLAGMLTLPQRASVRFMHRYPDGSGEAEVDNAGCSIDYIEVNLDGGAVPAARECCDKEPKR